MSTPVVDKQDIQHVKAAYMHPINPRDKMLYIFYVDIAKCFTLDINLINETILHLKHVLEKNYEIPVTKQVLLINGGECLADDTKICFYPAGTDTNPIFLFNRSFLESSTVQCYIPDLKHNNQIDNELNQQFESIENMSAPVSLYTIEKGSQLAKKYVEQATEAKMLCDKINTDQLLQQQGFSAALANLDDVLRTFEGQFAAFDGSYIKYLETRAKNIDLIDRFSEDLALLSKIPILPALLDGNEEERARLETLCESKTTDVSLLQWISAKEPEQSLENMIETCRAALLKYDEHALVSLKDDINTLISAEELSSVRNVGEIVEKLMNLQQICQRIKDFFNDQMSKSDGIQHNHRRISDLRDESILPDLIVAHRDTLRAMKANHTNIRNCRFMCLQTKKELCDIIHKKLKAVMTIQERAAEIRSMLVLHGANMKRVRGYVEVVQQLHSTPKNYFSAVSEVVRRRSYSQAFLMWASDLACKIFTIYSEETERRKKFMAQFEGHFLNCLFPGLEDMPSNFATQSPPLFDNNLPALCEDDLKLLCEHLSDLEECVQLPDVDAIRNFFLSKSLTLSEIEDDGKTKQRVSDDDRLAVVMSSSSACKTQDLVVAMSYEDSSTREKKDDQDEKSDRVKHENDMKTMRDGMAVLGTVAHNTVISLRNDLSALRTWAYSHQAEIIAVIQKLYTESQQQQGHIQTLLQKLHQKDDKIKSLYFKISTIETEKMVEESEEEKFEKRVNEAVAQQKAQIIKELTEELTMKHRKEIEALRQRFKLMTCTNMERSPSDTNLEKIEVRRGDIIEYSVHESAINQLKHDMEQQLNKAIANERYACKMKLDEEIRKVNVQFETEKETMEDSIRRPLVEEFEKQMDMMKIRETSMLSELQRHKETIHTLTGHEGGSYSLINRIEELEREKNRLESELIKERTSNYTFGSQSSFNKDSCSSTSLSSTSGSPDLQQGRTRFKERIAYKKGAGVGSHRSSQSIKSRASSSYFVPERISIQTCNVGDPVLVVWDEDQRNYTILQNSNTHYFLHPSSIDKLGLRPASDGSPRKLYCPAEVVEKEYCAPKKTTNRYNLKEGERFYRVKVRPLATERTL